MRFHPARVEVPAGDRLVIELTNTDDEDVHDLVLDDGSDTGRLSPGESARLDVGVVGRDVAGWCSVVGHRQMGMVLRRSRAVGANGRPRTAAVAARPRPPTTAAGLDLAGTPGRAFRRPGRRALPPLATGRVHRRTLHVREVVREVAPGVTQTLWTFNGTAPGPDPARAGRRPVRDHPGQRRHDRALDRLPRRRAGAPTSRCAPSRRASARLPVHRHPGRDLDVPLLDDADVGAHRQRHVRRGRHRAAGPRPRGPRYLLVQSELYLGAGGRRGRRRQGRRRASPTWWCSTATPTSTTTGPCAARVGRPGADLGARRRTEPGRRRSTSSAPSSTRRTPRAPTCCARGRRRSPEPGPRPRRRAGSSS